MMLLPGLVTRVASYVLAKVSAMESEVDFFLVSSSPNVYCYDDIDVDIYVYYVDIDAAREEFVDMDA